MNFKYNKFKNESGISKIEIIIAFGILFVIFFVGVPQILDSINNSNKAIDLTNATIIAQAAERIMDSQNDYSNFTTSGINISSINEAPKNTFSNELYKLLEGKIKPPKYKKTEIEEDNFILVINPDKEILVYIGSGDQIEEGKCLQLFPNASKEYQVEEN